MTASDPLTVGAVAVIVFMLAAIVHEGLGHGVACALLGGRLITVSSVQCQCDFEGLPQGNVQLIQAAGTAANLAIGLAFLGVLFYMPDSSPLARYFIWLSAVVNLLVGGGYLMASPFLGFGDWHVFVDAMPHRTAWKLILTFAGLAISAVALHAGRVSLEPFCGPPGPLRSHNAWLLTALPYAVGGCASCAVALLYPASRTLVVSSAAAATFGGTSWLLWIGFLAGRLPAFSVEPPLVISRSVTLIIAALVSLAFWALALAPGLRVGRRQ